MSLIEQKCQPCEGIGRTLTMEEAQQKVTDVFGWNLTETMLECEFDFKDFPEALAFVNKVGAIAEGEGHHPDIYLHSWNKVRLNLTTHALGGLTDNDFIVAAKINALS